MIPIPGSVFHDSFPHGTNGRVRWLLAFRITLRSAGTVGKRSFLRTAIRRFIEICWLSRRARPESRCGRIVSCRIMFTSSSFRRERMVSGWRLERRTGATPISSMLGVAGRGTSFKAGLLQLPWTSCICWRRFCQPESRASRLGGLCGGLGLVERTSPSGGEDDDLVTVRPVLDRVSCFADLLLEDRDEAFAALRRAENTGRPVGTAEFVAGLERVLGRRIARRAPGPAPAASVSASQLELLH
jgi:hypothetical protein